MTTQTSLWKDEQTLDEQYADWKAQNPHIIRQFFAEFNRLGVHWVKTGKRFGGKMVAEHLRYSGHFTSNGSEYKIQNSFVSYIGWDWQRLNPNLAPAMRTKGEKK